MSGGMILDMGDVAVIDAPYRQLDVLGSNVEYWNIFEGTNGNLKRNFAQGKPAPTVVGSPTWDPVAQAYTFKNQTNFLQLGMPHTAEMSFYAICLPYNGDSVVISNYGGPRKDNPAVTTTGFSLMPSRGSTSGAFIVTQSTNNGADTPGTLLQAIINYVPSKPNAIMGRFSPPGVGINGMSVFNMSNGLNGGFAYGAGQGPILGSPPRLGSAYGLSNTTFSTIMMAIVWSRVIGLSELSAVHAYFKAEYAAKGFDIGG